MHACKLSLIGLCSFGPLTLLLARAMSQPRWWAENSCRSKRCSSAKKQIQLSRRTKQLHLNLARTLQFAVSCSRRRTGRLAPGSSLNGSATAFPE